MTALAPPERAKYLAVQQLNSQTSANLSFYKNLIQKADAKLQHDFHAGANIEFLVYARCWYIEQIILNIWKQHHIEYSSLIAVGGFGRGELHPYSDIDLLILTEQDKEQSHEKTNETITKFIQFLWDLGLDIGHSIRCAEDCYKHAKKDVTVITNLMESRLLIGKPSQYQKMMKLIQADKIWNGADFFKAKWQEQISRHRKFGGTAYNLEPNIKEGPGGLRDIQMISWVTQRHFNKKTFKDLVRANFLTEDEYQQLVNGLRFLWKVRFALHILSHHKEERLLFGLQKQLASIFGYQSQGEDNLAVEQFMQQFYKNAMSLERLNHRLLQLFDENILQKNSHSETVVLNQHYQSTNNYIEIKEIELFKQKPCVYFELFQLMQQNPQIKGIRAHTSRAIIENKAYINSEFRQNKEVQAQFIDLFKVEKQLPELLDRLNRLGILAKYLPVFGNIVGRMQFDLFHVYTVDQHSLFVLKNLYKIRTHQSNIKMAHSVFDQVKTPYVVYFAGLFHDIAKGRGGSHAELGARDAYEFCQQHNINQRNTELIVWLVKEHLIMSVTAQKKDINDPKVIEQFCSQAHSLERLRCLYLLTIADIAATDPKLWNGFKESLLNELYLQAENHLNKAQKSSIIELKNSITKHLVLKNLSQDKISKHLLTLPISIFKNFNISKLENILAITCNNHQATVNILSSKNKSHEFLTYCKDFIGLFYCIASIFEKHNLNIVEAKINNTLDDYALNTFSCISEQREFNKDSLIQELSQALENQKAPDMNFSRHQSIREKHFTTKTKVQLHDSNSDNRTKIEVICKDRPGLLAIISKILLQSNITINAAKIATFGTRAEDSFWLSFKDRKLSETQIKQIKQQLEAL